MSLILIDVELSPSRVGREGLPNHGTLDKLTLSFGFFAFEVLIVVYFADAVVLSMRDMSIVMTCCLGYGQVTV